MITYDEKFSWGKIFAGQNFRRFQISNRKNFNSQKLTARQAVPFLCNDCAKTMHSRVEKVWIDPSYWLLFVKKLLFSIVLADVEVKNVLEDLLAAESCDKDATSSCWPFSRSQGTIFCNSTIRKLYPHAHTIASTQNSLPSDYTLQWNNIAFVLWVWFSNCQTAKKMFRKIFTNGQSMKILVNKISHGSL